MRAACVCAVGAVSAVLVLGGALPAAAQVPPPTPSGGQGSPPLRGKTPTVSASLDPAQPGVGYQGLLAGDQPSSGAGGGGATGRGSSGGCSSLSYSATVATYGQAQVNSWLFGSVYQPYGPYKLREVGPSPDSQHVGTPDNMYIVTCGGVATSFGYVFPTSTSAPAGPSPAAARTVAQGVAGQIPLPGVSIGVAPSPTGLTGLNGWFWVAGLPAAGAFTASANALGATISVKASPTSYVWNFGDATPSVATTTPGTPYPGPDGTGAIHHTYQSENRTGYPLSLTFVLAVGYQVNGGPTTNLGTVRRTITLTYPVEQVVSAITARG